MDNFKIGEQTQNAITLLNYMQSTVLELRDRNVKLLEKNEKLLLERDEYAKENFLRLTNEVRSLRELNDSNASRFQDMINEKDKKISELKDIAKHWEDLYNSEVSTSKGYLQTAERRKKEQHELMHRVKELEDVIRWFKCFDTIMDRVKEIQNNG